MNFELRLGLLLENMCIFLNVTCLKVATESAGLTSSLVENITAVAFQIDNSNGQIPGLLSNEQTVDNQHHGRQEEYQQKEEQISLHLYPVFDE